MQSLEKMVSCVGDIFLAWYAMRITKKVIASQIIPKLVFTSVLFLPTVVINSSAWGQCDSLYTAALLACIFYLLDDRSARAMLAFGVSFVFKLQAVFLLPFLFLLFLKRKLPIRHLFLVPLVYIVTILPAFIAGYPLANLLTLYISQAGTYDTLSLCAPNLYAWLSPENPRPYALVGIALAAVFVLAVVCLVLKKKICISPIFLLKFAFLSAIMMPFFLSYMHERYFYLADVLAVICFFVLPKMRLPAIIVVTCSFFVVASIMFVWPWVNAAYLSIPMMLAFVAILKDTLFGNASATTALTVSS